jgi:choline dehydrogenase-like flavoprotein
MPTMQAIARGGGSLVNSAICVRAPAATLDAWCDEFGLRRTRRSDLDPHYQAIEEFLGIAPTPDDVQGRRNLLFRDACHTLGISSEPIPRNVHACRGSGECFTGCRARAKQSMDISYVPAAVRAGPRPACASVSARASPPYGKPAEAPGGSSRARPRRGQRGRGRSR